MPIDVGSTSAAGATLGTVVPGVGTVIGGTAGAVLGTAANVWQSIGSLFKGSPPVDWKQANSLAEPTAKAIVQNLTSSLGASKLQAVFYSYVAKLKGYIAASPHNPTQREAFIRAIDLEAIGQGGGFRVDGFPFDTTIQVQLAWAIWLHAHWIYGGVSQDEVGNGNALKKFQDSLRPTLVAAVSESTGETIVETGVTTPPPAVKEGVFSPTKIFTTPILLALAGAAVLFLILRGKK